MIRRLRIILPPSEVLVAAAAAYLLIELPFWFVRLRWGVVPSPGRHPIDLILVAAAVSYGGYRVIAFHPFYRPAYRTWLERTPWTHRKPLPAGPVAWVWEDLPILLGLAALARADGDLDPVLVATLPLVSGAAFLTAALFPTGSWSFGYATAFALGLAVRLGPHRWAFLAAAAGANVLGHIGFRCSLARFPWPLERWQAWQGTASAQLQIGEGQARATCGWPFDQLRPDLPDYPRIGLADAALISLLAGWWISAVGALIPDPRDRAHSLLLVLLMGTTALGIGRFFVYRGGFAPPINLWGRLLTFRWIIPGYDQLYLGPVCTILVPWPFLMASERWGVPDEVALPLGFSVMMFVALSCKPSLRRWRLTGQHRIVPTLQQRNESIRVG